MKRISLFLIVLLTIGCNQNSHKDYNHNNLDQEHLVTATLWYQHSPEAKSLYYQGFNVAKERVLEFKNKPGEKPKAIVVDLDETMIDNSPFQGRVIETGVGYSPEIWAKWTDRAMAKALPGAVEFTHFCDSVGVEIFYLSNRTTKELESTMQNLNSLGFSFVKPENMVLKDSISGKEPRRKSVAKKYDIILLLGDNLNDFSDVFESRGDDWGLSIVDKYKEEFGRRFIVFPNPMYGEWEKNIFDHEKNLNNQTKFKKRREKIISYK
jgi:5'-nucleotidase (lipoprotein e(P4) family)